MLIYRSVQDHFSGLHRIKFQISVKAFYAIGNIKRASKTFQTYVYCAAQQLLVKNSAYIVFSQKENLRHNSRLFSVPIIF